MVAGRRTNLALLVLLAVALATGGLMYAIGTAANRWATAVHDIAGIAIVFLAPWKSMVVRHGLRRRAAAGAVPSIILAVLIVVAVVTGVAHAAGARTLGPLTSMQVHVGAALFAVPLALWHVVARPVTPRRTDLSRRTVLRAGGVAAGATAAFGVMEGLLVVTGSPGGDRRFTGSHEIGSGDPAAMPVVQWLDDDVPLIDTERWQLTVGTGEGAPRTWALDELSSFDDEVTAVLDCTGGWWATQAWRGVRLDRLLGASSGREGNGGGRGDPVGGDARSIVVTSATGYQRRYPIADVGALWLATGVAGRALSPGHGAPARIVAPGRRGFWWVKWVERIEISGRPWWWQTPFPLT